MKTIIFCGELFMLISWLADVRGHGRLMEPPNRSSIWRFQEFKTNPPINYNDDELSCGGFPEQYVRNGGECGPCGNIKNKKSFDVILTLSWERGRINPLKLFVATRDPYDVPVPRENENGGKYGRAIIVRKYKSGQKIPIAVELTRSHLGYFKFQICPLLNPRTDEIENCFGEPMPLADGSGSKYYVSTLSVGYFNTTIILPNTQCSHCVLRWHYRTGSCWGDCGNGTVALGCGNQEIFRGCSDIIIA